MGTSGEASAAGNRILVNPAIQSGINTINNWRTRRIANGKEVSHAELIAHIQELWPNLTGVDVAQIVKGVLE